MSTHPSTDPAAARDHLLREVSVPEFFAKLAAEAGVGDFDEAHSQQLLLLGDQIAPAVHRFVDKQAAAGVTLQRSVIEKAAAAARDVAGLAPPGHATPAAYLQAGGVRDAALLVADAMRKQATGAACGPGHVMPVPPKPVEEEEESEEEKKARAGRKAAKEQRRAEKQAAQAAAIKEAVASALAARNG